MSNDDEEDVSGIREKFWAEQMRMHERHKQKQWDPEVQILLSVIDFDAMINNVLLLFLL